MDSLAFVFPGQNSRYPAMLEKLLEWDPRNAAWIERASTVVGRDLRRHYRASNPDLFARNRDVQIGVFLANHLHWQNLERAGVRAEYSAGLSLGEYNHLVHIGALEFDDAVRLLEARGRAYERGPSGKMIALVPVDQADVRRLIAELHLEASVSVAMINTPRQIVISGDAAAVELVAARAEDEFAAHVAVVDEALPMHSSLFRGVAAEFCEALAAVRWRNAAGPYLPNVLGRFVRMSAPGVFVNALSRHVCDTVRWRDSIDAIAQAAPGAVFVEAGPRAVLTGMFGRKWLSPIRFATDAAEDLGAGLAAVVEELTGGSGRAAVSF